MELRDRVSFRFERRRADAIVDPKSTAHTIASHLPEFVQYEQDALVIQDLISKLRELRARDPNSTEQKPLWEGVYAKDREFQKILQYVRYYFYLWFRDSWELGLALLQQFSMQAPVRRKIEKMVKFWVTKQTPKRTRFKGPLLDQTGEAVALYLEQIKVLREQQAAVLEALAHGKPMSEADEAKVKAGPFTLINAGGFNEATMAEAANVAEKAAKLLSAKGFGRVCYGDIHITKKIGRSNVLAFYMNQGDEFFIRAGVRLNVNTLHTVLHEFGHRMHRKFLQAKNKDIEALFSKYSLRKRVNLDQGPVNEEQIPPIGEEVEYKKKTLVVTDIDRIQRKIKLVPKGAPDMREFYTVPFNAYGALFKGEVPKPKPVGFVTTYAGTKSSEMFAEMFAFYCTDELSPEQEEDFKQLLD